MMKLGVFYWALSSAILACGLALMVTGAVVHTNTNDRVSFIETAENVTALDISLRESALELRSTDDADACTIEFVSVSEDAGMSEDDGLLSIYDTKKKWFSFLSFGWRDYDSKIILTVPKTEYENVRIDLGLADDNSIRNLACLDLDLDMGTGDVNLKKVVVAHEFQFHGGTGNVDIESLEVDNKFTMGLGTGSIEMKDCRFGSDLLVDAGTGDFRCKDMTVLGNLDVDLGAGDLKLEKVDVDGTCEFDCGTGNLTAEKSKFHQLDMDCGAGNVTMKDTKLLGDVEIDHGAGNLTIEIDGKATNYWLDIDQGAGKLESGGIPMGTPLASDAHVIRVDGGAGNIQFMIKD